MTPPRPTRYCSALKPRCVAGHRITPGPFAIDRLMTCDHRPAGQGPCGRHLYLVKYHVAAEPLLQVIEISQDELRYLDVTPLTMLERLHYLGLTVPGTDRDLQRSA